MLLSSLAMRYAVRKLTKGTYDLSTRNHPQTYYFTQTQSRAFTK